MKQKIAPWLPMIFCVSLSGICLAGHHDLANSPVWAIPFLCFLPMCFFFVAAVTSQLQREVCDLREQVARLTAEKQVGTK